MTNLNKKAPDFTLMGSDKKPHSLKDYLGKKVILYFYPRDNTPGCTLEAESFRDNSETLSGENAHSSSMRTGYSSMRTAK